MLMFATGLFRSNPYKSRPVPVNARVSRPSLLLVTPRGMSVSASKLRRKSLLPSVLPSSLPSLVCCQLGEATGVPIWEIHIVYRRKRVGNVAVLLSGCVFTYTTITPSMAGFTSPIDGGVRSS